jgi:hypothetical protein
MAKKAGRRCKISIRELILSESKGKLRRAAGQARLRRSTEFLLSPRIAKLYLAWFKLASVKSIECMAPR